MPAGTELHAAAAFFVKGLVRHAFFPPSVTSVCSLSLTTPVGCGTKQTKFRDRSNGTWPKKESTCVTKRRAADAWRQGGAPKIPCNARLAFGATHTASSSRCLIKTRSKPGLFSRYYWLQLRSQLGNRTANTSCPNKHPLLRQTRDPLSRRRQEKSSQDMVNSRASIPLLWLGMLKGV